MVSLTHYTHWSSLPILLLLFYLRSIAMAQPRILLNSSSRLYPYEYMEHTKEYFEKLLKPTKVKTILFLPYALNDYDWYEKLVAEPLAEWGLKVVSIHRKPDPVKAIREAEAIFIGGGNSFLLLKHLYDKGLVEPIREQVLQKGVPFIGSSAGSNVATRSIQTTNDMPIIYPPTFDALALVPFNINPHYVEKTPDPKFAGGTQDTNISEFLELNDYPVLAMPEGSALVVEGKHITLMGPFPVKLFQRGKEPKKFPPGSDLDFLLNIVPSA